LAAAAASARAHVAAIVRALPGASGACATFTESNKRAAATTSCAAVRAATAAVAAS
jgi:hypothetical protein